jgi:hypothetical protein
LILSYRKRALDVSQNIGTSYREEKTETQLWMPMVLLAFIEPILFPD